MGYEKNNHHTAFNRLEWSLRPQGLYIRENSSMIARGMSVAAHNLLHEMCPPVPVPQHYTLMHVARDLPQGLDIVQGIDTYCELVEESNRHPRIKPVERQLNLLSIEAIRQQLPFIREGRRSAA